VGGLSRNRASGIPPTNKPMQNTVEYTGVNKRVSPATVELLIRERSKGKSLRQLGHMFNRSGERIRQILAKYDLPQVALLPESIVAAKLGYPRGWLTQLRKEGVIRPGGYWLYSEEQVRQIPALIAEARKCEQCGKPRPLGSVRFCRECRQERRKESQARAYRKHPAKYFERTDYVVSRGNYLPLGTIVKVKASHPSNPALAILGNGLEIPFSCLRKMRL